MTKSTRYFLTGSAVVLLVGLGTGLVAYYKGDLAMFQRQIGPEELVYVPADVSGVAYANVRDIMNSEFRQKLRTVLPTGEGKDQFLNETGIDIERDIQSVVAAAGAGEPEHTGLILIRGIFDEPRIDLLVKQHGGTTETYKGKTLLMLHERHGEGERASGGFCLTFPETGLALLGSETMVKRALDTRESKQNVTGNEQMMKLVTEFHGLGNTAWAVGNLSSVSNNQSVPQQVRDQLPGIEWVGVSAHVNGGLSGRMKAQAIDDKAATDLRAVVNGAIAAGRLVGGKNPQVEPFLNSIQVGGGGKDVEMAFTLPPAMLDMIGALHGPKHLESLPQRQLN
jgi:hypothetical protein